MDYSIIPAYNPEHKLIEVVTELMKFNIRNIIVVNDGSEEKTLEIFKELEKQVTLLHHEVNKGKGAAIKTALRHISENDPDAWGIILLDADGQHKPEDALRLLSVLYQGHTGLVLGTRSFRGRIPLRSFMGNTITKYVFRLCSGKWIFDTQTGLRAFTKDLIPELLQVKGERYEYEMNMLFTCVKNNYFCKDIQRSL